MLGFTKSTSSKASDRLRLAMDQWKIQPPPAQSVTAPPAQRVRPVAGAADSLRPRLQFAWSPRSLKALGWIVALIVLVLGFQWWTAQSGGTSPVVENSETVGVLLPEEDSGVLTLGQDVVTGGVTVHVAGAVKSPGLYELPLGSRVAEAVEAAGGVTKKSAADSVNLARELIDGEQILVGATGSSAQAGISINSASATQLEELPGIGPVLAERIVSHRTSNGPFTSIDQLGNVSGIGDSVLEQIRVIATL
jgi:competence protein ComEA